MDATKSLQERYDALASISSTRDFFIAFADYMDFIGSKPSLARIVRKISMQGDPLREKLKNASSKALDRISEIKNELAAYVAENKIEKLDIKAAFLQYDGYLNGNIITMVGVGGVLGSLHDQLRDVVQMLYDMPQYKDFASHYIEFKNEKREMVNHFLPIQELDYYLEVRDDWSAAQKTALWAILEYLLTLYRIIRCGDEKMQLWWEYEKEERSLAEWLLTARHQMMLAEWKAIEISRRDIEKTFFVISEVAPLIAQLQSRIVSQQLASTSENTLESIHLVTASLEPTTAIFLVLDGQFSAPIRCPAKNLGGGPTYMKKLYDIAYLADAPGKKVSYLKGLADNINNALFRMDRVKQYMAKNKLKKPTLVEKTTNDTLALSNEVVVKTMLIRDVPRDYKVLYIEKTQ